MGGFDIDKYLERAKKGEKLEELAIKLICIKIKELFIKEENVKSISSPVTCIGDTHGYYNYIRIIKSCKIFKKKLIFGCLRNIQSRGRFTLYKLFIFSR